MTPLRRPAYLVELARKANVHPESARAIVEAIAELLAAGREVRLPGLGRLIPWTGRRVGAANLARGDSARKMHEAAGVTFTASRSIRRELRNRVILLARTFGGGGLTPR
jgi:hypothetical protein